MVRIGVVSSADELKLWHDWEYNKQRHSTWVNSLEVLMDVDQSAYCSEDPHSRRVNQGANSLWDVCAAAFFEEGGFDVLLNLLDPKAFADLAADKVPNKIFIFSCQMLAVHITFHFFVCGACRWWTRSMYFTVKSQEF
jgi:hypothetical protein